MSAREMTGTMLWFDEASDVGYILAEDGDRIAVRGTGFAGARPEGRCARTRVTFELAQDAGRRTAHNVVLAPEPDQRRPRRTRRNALS